MPRAGDFRTLVELLSSSRRQQLAHPTGSSFAGLSQLSLPTACIMLYLMKEMIRLFHLSTLTPDNREIRQPLVRI